LQVIINYHYISIYACHERGNIVFFVESEADVSDIHGPDDMAVRLSFETLSSYTPDLASLSKEALEYVYERIPEAVRTPRAAFERQFSRFYEASSEKDGNCALRRYIFLTAEGTTTAPNGEDVENLQVLGFIYGKDGDSAEQAFIEENDWMFSQGFSRDNIQALELVNHL
jgi:hypothetical protein